MLAERNGLHAMKRCLCFWCGIVACMSATNCASPLIGVQRAPDQYALSASGQAAYFEVYGATSPKTESQPQTLVGTSRDGARFSVAGYSHFILHVPPGSLVRIDAIALDDCWVESRPGPDYAHSFAHMKPTGEPDRPLYGWKHSDTYTEGPPDGITIENDPTADSYYGFSTLGASYMTIYTVAH